MKLSKVHVFLICIIVVSLITTGVVIALNLPKVSYSLNQPNTSESTEEVEFFPKSKEEALEFLVGTWREEYTYWQDNLDWVVKTQLSELGTFGQIEFFNDGTFIETKGYLSLKKYWGKDEFTLEDYKTAIEEWNEVIDSEKGFVIIEEECIYFVFLGKPTHRTSVGSEGGYYIRYINGNPDKIEIKLGKNSTSSSIFRRIK